MIELLLALSALSDAQKIPFAVASCDIKYHLELMKSEATAAPHSWEFRDWDLIKLDLGDAYLGRGCAAEAEKVFTAIINTTRDTNVLIRAKAGLARSLAPRPT